jgi:exodeoxyribonuclease VII small subunit
MESKMKFEDKLKRLDEIVDTMSNKSLALDDSLALYEEGNKIIKELEEALKEAENKIEKVIESK